MPVSSDQLAEFLEVRPPIGAVLVSRVAALGAPQLSDALTFAQGAPEVLGPAVTSSDAALMLVTPELAPFRKGPALIVTNPRLAMSKVVRRFFAESRVSEVSRLASIHPSARIGARPHIAAFVVIGADVEVGDDAVILEHTTIRGRVKIGHRVYIKPGTVVGAEGFGIEFEPSGAPVRIPQIGGVNVGDDVEFGCLNTICSGTLLPTIVRDEVKCDDHVHIAHNCDVGARSILTAGTVLSGSVKVGEGCWLGPNSSVMNKATLGRRTLVGLGAVVTKSTEDETVVAGNPATVRRKRDE